MMGANDENENWIWGVVLGVLGSIAINCGNNIQVLGLQRIQKIKEEEDSDSQSSIIHPSKSPMWIFGTIVFLSGSLLNFASFAFAPQSMLASLQSVQFVTNVIFGKLILKKKISKQVVGGTILTVFGTVLTVQFSAKKVVQLSTDDIIPLYKNAPYIIYLCLSSLAAVGLEIYYQRHREINLLDSSQKNTQLAVRISYVLTSAIVGTHSVVQAKILAEILEAQIQGREHIFKHHFTYISIVLWALTAVIWVKRMTSALSKFDPIVIIPMLQVAFIVLAILSGGIFFEEFDTFFPLQWVGFVSGVLVMLMGLGIITKGTDIKAVELDVFSFSLPDYALSIPDPAEASLPSSKVPGIYKVRCDLEDIDDISVCTTEEIISPHPSDSGFSSDILDSPARSFSEIS
mmetsp:Transcript_31975/g.63338  ORF Transcript_31975/g.63338 Transcript_31975/m.63338 type:complete len:402 (+) Transcript_31975:265-1470(+)